TSIATITSGGLLKGLTVGSATITASSGTASATASATVTLGNVTALTLSPTSVSLAESTTATGSQCFTVMATLSSGPEQDVTATVTWVAVNSSLITVANGEDPMCVETSTTTGSTTVYAQYTSGTSLITSNSATVNVN
ncbi:MAG: hypothetical protein WCC95_02000, partial [Candidatus Sulfotelmatobacter sp.]